MEDMVCFNVKNRIVEGWQIPIPCGYCTGCVERKKQEWIGKLTLEHMASRHASFLMFSYDEENLPEKLIVKDIQDFMKRLRRHEEYHNENLRMFRHFTVGEYGTRKGRPHWHMILFGRTPVNKPNYPAEDLIPIWKKGWVSDGVVTKGSMAYILKYLTKEKGCVKIASQGIGHSKLKHLAAKLAELKEECDWVRKLMLDGKEYPLNAYDQIIFNETYMNKGGLLYKKSLESISEEYRTGLLNAGSFIHGERREKARHFNNRRISLNGITQKKAKSAARIRSKRQSR